MHHIPLNVVRTALLYANTLARFHLSDQARPVALAPWLRNRLNRRFAISTH